MLHSFGTLFATWHIYHYLTFDVSRGTLYRLAPMFHVEHFCTVAQISLHNCAQLCKQVTKCFTWNDETGR